MSTPAQRLNEGTTSHGGSSQPWHLAERREDTEGKSVKFRLVAEDGASCECVALFPRPTRATACLSTQIGCAVACRFCATGRMGLTRNLTAAEILAQLDWVAAESKRKQVRLRNVVFMGMGEPLHNYQQLVAALEVILAPRGYGLGPTHITVSTAGITERMLALARGYPLVRQALSLHSAIPEKRRQLVPKATADMRLLRETIGDLNRLQPKSPVWLEYVLLQGINDMPEDLAALIDFCAGLRVELNIIPYNAFPGKPAVADTERLMAPGRELQDSFIRQLRQAGIFTTLRKSLGDSIAAACGQLVIAQSSPTG
jgi:23S rRNA (adenine2503-C2)-methyltransferase